MTSGLSVFLFLFLFISFITYFCFDLFGHHFLLLIAEKADNQSEGRNKDADEFPSPKDKDKDEG